MFRQNKVLFVLLLFCFLLLVTIVIILTNTTNNLATVTSMYLWLPILLVALSCIIILIAYLRQIHYEKISVLKKLNTFLSDYIGDGTEDAKKENVESIIEKVAALAEKFNVLKAELHNRDVFRKSYFNTMINGLVVHNKMEILEVNRAMCEITGFTEEEFRSLTLDKLLLPHESLTGEISDNTSRLYYRSMCFPKNGQKFPIDIQMSGISLDRRNMQISVVRDLREKRDIEEQLQSERARRMKAIFDGQEMERRRLAKEIHDGLGQSLIAIRLLIEGKIALSSEVDKDALEKIRSLIDRTIDDARLMSNNLMPSVLNEFGFVTALRQMCDHVRQSTNIKVGFEVECSKFMLSSVQTVYLFRIAQEAVNNILKHSHATEMTVRIDQTESNLSFRISDNGRGIRNDRLKQADGNGLFNMKERVQLLKGEFEINSEPGKGTEIYIVIPNWRLVANE